MITINSLRGGGVCSSQKQIELEKNQSFNPNVYELFSKFNHYVQIIEQKASLAANQKEYSEIMISIQWFVFQEENIYKLNKSFQSVKKSYDLIIEGIKRLLNSCLIYIRTDQLITTSLSKVIFSFHLMNDKRFMEFEDQKQFLNMCEKLRIQMKIEKNDFIQNQLELFLFLTQMSFEIAPNNSDEKEEILKGCLKGIMKSIINMSPDAQLLESLFQGAKLIHQNYNINKKRRYYELYYQLDMLQWEILLYFQNKQRKSFQDIIFQIKGMYEMTIKDSVSWKDHYLWIQVIGKIIMYNPILTKKRLNQAVKSLNIQEKSINQIWEDYKTQGFLIQVNYSDDSAVILLEQFQNNENQKNVRQILEHCFKGLNTFTELKNHLINQEQKTIPYTIGSYIKSKLNLIIKEKNADQNILASEQIQKFLSFLVSDKLLELIKQNFDKLEIVIEIWKNLATDKFINLEISQSSYKTEIKKMIENLEQYHLNILNILKICWLKIMQSGFLLEMKQNYKK